MVIKVCKVVVDEEITKKASCVWAYVEAAGWSKG